MDARRDRPRADDDARAGPVLRGPRALQEHPQHVHDVPRRDRDRRRDVGARRLLAGLRRRRRDHRRPGPRLPAGRRLRAPRRHDDPAPAVHGLPGDLLHHHRRAGLGRGRRADALRGLPRLRGAVVGARLRGARPLGLRRRLAAGRRDARLRRRRAGRDGLRLLGAGGRAGRWRPQGLRAPGAAAPQRHLRAARRRPALVRLVRLQRRQRLLGRQLRRARLHQHAAVPGLHARRLVRARPAARPQGDGDRRGDGDHRRLRRHHPRGRLRQPGLGDGAGRGRRAAELRDHRLAPAHARGRDARRARRPRHRGLHRHPLHRLLRPAVLERGGGRPRSTATRASSAGRRWPRS